MLYLELAELDVDALAERLASPSPEGDEYAADVHDVTWHLRVRGSRGTEILLACLPAADEYRAAAILNALSSPPADASMISVIRAYLDDARPLVLMTAIDGLWHLGDRHVHDRIVALRDHASPYVRGAVVRYLSRLFLDEALPYLRAALRDPHFVVRESAIDEIDELDFVEAIDDIRPFLNDPHPDVRQAARTALANYERSTTPIGKETGNHHLDIDDVN